MVTISSAGPHKPKVAWTVRETSRVTGARYCCGRLGGRMLTSNVMYSCWKPGHTDDCLLNETCVTTK
jgi:hypothetical protein